PELSTNVAKRGDHPLEQSHPAKWVGELDCFDTAAQRAPVDQLRLETSMPTKLIAARDRASGCCTRSSLRTAACRRLRSKAAGRVPAPFRSLPLCGVYGDRWLHAPQGECLFRTGAVVPDA